MQTNLLRKSTKGLGVVAVILLVLLAIPLSLLFNGWIIMLLVGAIFPHFGWATWGLGLSVLVGLGLSFVGALLRGVSK